MERGGATRKVNSGKPKVQGFGLALKEREDSEGEIPFMLIPYSNLSF